MSSFSFERLNEAQKQAVLATEGPVLIVAGPGTGKTFTLVKRISYLVKEKNVKPSEIMVVTFTEKAGKELLNRISNEFVDLDLNINDMYIGTFHAVCLRILKEYAEYTEVERHYRMLDAFEQAYMVCCNIELFNRFKGFNQYISEPGPWKQSLVICRYVNQLMEELVDIDAMENDYDEDMRFLAKIVKRYQELFERNKVMDFSSIQTKTYEMLDHNPSILEDIQNRIKYIMVDEYQDTNYIQEQLLMMIAGNLKNICVVGDDDQGMYRFRGATIRNILEFANKFDDCKVIHLDINYRSEPGIIDFYNRWMSNVENTNLFNWDKYRLEKRIVSAKKQVQPENSVYVSRGESIDSEKVNLLNLILDLKERGNINNYNQIAFLFRSVKSDEATKIGEWFEKNGIPVYSPRSDLFFKRQEIMQLIGCFIMCFTSYMIDLKQNKFLHDISAGLRRYYINCLKKALVLIKKDLLLKQYIDSVKLAIDEIKDEADFGLLNIFYRLIAHDPFKTYLQANIEDHVLKNRAARNLSEFSRMISRYIFIHNMHNVSPNNKIAMPEEFFNIYLKYMIEDGIGEYEDESDYAPTGCVSFMTIHQSKGLEFPAVVVGSLSNNPRRNRDPLLYTAENRFFHRPAFEPIDDIKYFDFWRLYYTAFSRAQNLLVLTTKKAQNKYFDNYLQFIPNIKTFTNTEPFSAVKPINYKHVYSFTSHISVYDGCSKQYKYYKEYRFAQNKMFHTAVGTLVHATLEDMNKCAINGRKDKVDEESIAKWFELNYQSMEEQTGFTLTDEQRESAYNQVINYYHHRKDSLGKVWRAEEEINLVLPKYILQGVIDLIEGDEDTVDIVDYKTGPKPDITGHPERVEHYRKQLEIYAYLIEKRYGKKVSQMHLYYTNCQNNDPLITFTWTRDAIDHTIAEISQTINKIEQKQFEQGATNSYACTFCDMRYLCGKTT